MRMRIVVVRREMGQLDGMKDSIQSTGFLLLASIAITRTTITTTNTILIRSFYIFLHDWNWVEFVSIGRYSNEWVFSHTPSIDSIRFRENGRLISLSKCERYRAEISWNIIIYSCWIAIG